METTIVPCRAEISDRFPVASFAVNVPASRLFEVACATDPRLFHTDWARYRSPQNFYTSRAEGLLRAPGGQTAWFIPPDQLRRFAGSPRVYYALATYENAYGGAPAFTIAPHALEQVPSIALAGDFTGRGLDRSRLGIPATSPDHYGAVDSGPLRWGGDDALAAYRAAEAPSSGEYDDGYPAELWQDGDAPASSQGLGAYAHDLGADCRDADDDFASAAALGDEPEDGYDDPTWHSAALSAPADPVPAEEPVEWQADGEPYGAHYGTGDVEEDGDDGYEDAASLRGAGLSDDDVEEDRDDEDDGYGGVYLGPDPALFGGASASHGADGYDDMDGYRSESAGYDDGNGYGTAAAGYGDGSGYGSEAAIGFGGKGYGDGTGYGDVGGYGDAAGYGADAYPDGGVHGPVYGSPARYGTPSANGANGGWSTDGGGTAVADPPASPVAEAEALSGRDPAWSEDEPEEEPLPVGRAATALAAIPLDIPEKVRILRVVALAESRRDGYAAINPDNEYNTPSHPAYRRYHIGLSWGFIQFTQRSGQLGKVLRAIKRREEAPGAAIPADQRFDRLFGPHGEELLRVTNADSEEERVAPVGGKVLWDPEWTARFRAAGAVPHVTYAQNEVAITSFVDPNLRLASWLELDTPRALAMLWDRCIHMGNGGGVSWVMRSAGPVRTDEDRRAALAALGHADLRAFQQSQAPHLAVDGKWGPRTHAALTAALRALGSRSPIAIPSRASLLQRLADAAQGTRFRERVTALHGNTTDFADAVQYALV